MVGARSIEDVRQRWIAKPASMLWRCRRGMKELDVAARALRARSVTSTRQATSSAHLPAFWTCPIPTWPTISSAMPRPDEPDSRAPHAAHRRAIAFEVRPSPSAPSFSGRCSRFSATVALCASALARIPSGQCSAAAGALALWLAAEPRRCSWAGARGPSGASNGRPTGTGASTCARRTDRDRRASPRPPPRLVPGSCWPGQ